MKVTMGRLILLMAFVIISGCVVALPPPSTVAAPEPPPAYGANPHQRMAVSRSASGEQPGYVSSTNAAGSEPMSEGEAMQYLKEAISTRVEQLAAGFNLEGEIASSRVSAGEEKKFAISVFKGKCTRVIAMATPSIAKLDMYFHDGKKLLDRDVGMDNFPVVSFCFNSDKEVMLTIKVENGSGWFLVRVYTKKNDGTVKRTMDVVEGSTAGAPQ